MPVDWDELPSPTQTGSSATVDGADLFGIDTSLGTFKGGLWKSAIKPPTVSNDMPFEVPAEEVEVTEILPITGPPGPTGLQGTAGSQGVQGVQGVPGTSSQEHTYIAAQALGAQRAVRLVGANTVDYMDSTNPLHVSKFAGVTSGAALSGGNITIVSVGPMNGFGLLTSGDPLYVNSVGSLVHTLPAKPVDAFIQQVAYATGASTAFILPQPPILLF